MIVQPRTAKDAVRMTIDEAGKQHAPDFLGPDVGSARSLMARAYPRDAVALDQYGGILQDFDVRHLAAAAGAGRSSTGHNLPGADEQRLQSRSPLIGRRM